ncbi:hypothetical protein DYB34_004298 [Aphanomyces astaci]|uniref:CID domain-containing protein n=1 Tax=Aphanomyces astaci TaxID=112090 RepID=A0A3R7DR46_APHAT|nr:hypothetical protein DYB34_004298 [Aphanomyces astaci]
MGDKVVSTLKQYDGMINEMGAYPAKPIINTLTMLAEDLTMAKHIAPFLVKKLNVVGPPYRLPILYLMDSIIKNVGGPYAYLFSQTLAPVYVDSVRQVNATDLNRFNHVLKTWETARLLPPAVLMQMRAAADSALRVAQPSDQPTSFASRGGGPVGPSSRVGVPPRPSSSSDAHLELQMRRLLTQLQTEDGVHPAKQLSLEEVRAQNPDLYATLKLNAIRQCIHNKRLINEVPRGSCLHTTTIRTPTTDPVMTGDCSPYLRRSAIEDKEFHRRRIISPFLLKAAPPLPRGQPQATPTGQDVMNLLKKINAMSAPPSSSSSSSRRYQHQVTSATLGRPLTCADVAVNKKRIGDNVYRLYDALPHVSTSSGLRFKDQAQCWDEDEEEWMYQNAVVGSIESTDVVPKQTIFHKYCYDSAVASSKSKVILPSQLAPGSPVVVGSKRPMSEVEEDATWRGETGRVDDDKDEQQDINKRLKLTHADETGGVL